MTTKKRSLIGAALLPAAIFAFTSCSTTPKGEMTTLVVTQEGVPGGVILQAFQTTATVTALDPATRKYTLKRVDGEAATFTAGPEMVNFDQLRVGDVVKASQTEELAVSIVKLGSAPASTGESTQIIRAPKGSKPGIFMTRAREVTATVRKVELKDHKVTLQFLDGQTKTIKVSHAANLAAIHPGDEVVVSLTETVTVEVVNPH